MFGWKDRTAYDSLVEISEGNSGGKTHGVRRGLNVSILEDMTSSVDPTTTKAVAVAQLDFEKQRDC